MKSNLVNFATRAITAGNPSSSSSWRHFCSSPATPSPTIANKKLFVAGLSWSVDEKSLKDAFSSFGDVTEVRIMYDKDSGRSRGFGFVNFTSVDEASSAKDAMDGKAFLGRPMRISFAHERVRGVPSVVPHITGSEKHFLSE